MSSKLLGIGLLGAGCMVAAASAGYLALRPPSPLPIPEAVIVPAVPADTEVTANPDTAPKAPDELRAPKSAPAKVPSAEKTVVPAATKAENRPAQASSSDRLPDPKTLPVAPSPTAVPPVVPGPVESPVATPVPTVDSPRYVPDAPLPVVTPAQEPAKFEIEELTVEKHSVIGIRLDASVSTRTAHVEDRVSATVSRDVTVGSRTAIPAGVRLEGTVTLVERGGRFKSRPRIGLRFDRMILADGTRVSINTDTIYREGDSPAADSTARVGTGAVAGAILGAVLGGKKGAVIGTVAGAAGGAATVLKDDASETSLPAGAPLTVRLAEDVVVTINR